MASDYSWTGWRLLAAIVTLAWIVTIPALQFTQTQQTFLLKSGAVKHENGCAYTIQLDQRPDSWPITRFETDSVSATTASLLMLLEDGRPAGQPHALHENIRSQAAGNYSHWGDNLYFSATDCSDPRTNGRAYEVTMSGSLSVWVKYVWLIAVFAFCFQMILLTAAGKKVAYDPAAITAGLFMSLMAAGFIVTARGAADVGAYLAWAHYFSTFDLATFSGFPRSITGVPLIQWSYGAGLLAAIPAVIFSYAGAFPAPLVAMLLGLANLGLIIYIARSTTGSYIKATLVLAGIVLFMPAGFYLNKYSAEGWTVFLVLSGLALMEWDNKSIVRRTSRVTFLLGVVIYFLLLVKIQNIVLCAGLWLIFVASNLTPPLIGRDNRVFVIRHTLILALVSGVGLAFLLLFNHIVSDSFSRSPYDVGDMEFSMFSLRNAKFFEVLFSPWHGLLMYHPAIALGVYGLLRALITNRELRRDFRFLVIFAGLAAMALQVLMQGSWFIWWMGTGTYGARGFAGASILLAYAVMKSDLLKHQTVSNLTYVTFMVLGGFSAIMLSHEETNIVDYKGILQLLKDSNWQGVVALIVGVQLIQSRLKLDRYTQMIGILLALAAFPVIYNGINGSTNYIVIALVALLIMLLLRYMKLSMPGMHVSGIAQRLFTASIMIVFTISIMLQALLLRGFYQEARVNEQTGYSLDCNEYVASYNEYQHISGYEQEKRELYNFLTRQKCI